MMHSENLMTVCVQAAFFYIFLLILVRALGKRSIGDLNALDFLVTVMIAKLIAEPIYGSVSVAHGVGAILVIAGLHYLHSVAGYHFESFAKLTGGTPRVLIRDGIMDQRAMRKEHMSQTHLLSLLRRREIDRLEDVALATLEPSGDISVIRTEGAKDVQKRDLKGIAA